MSQKRPDIQVAHRQAAFFFATVMDDCDQAIAVLAKIENHVSVDIVGVPKDLPYLGEVPPPGFASDLVPGPNFLCCIWIRNLGFSQVLASYDMHKSFSDGRDMFRSCISGYFSI
jgi:hypothetical protein